MKISLCLILAIFIVFFIGCSQDNTLTTPERVESNVLKEMQNNRNGIEADTLKSNENLNAGMIRIGYKPGEALTISMVNDEN